MVSIPGKGTSHLPAGFHTRIEQKAPSYGTMILPHRMNEMVSSRVRPIRTMLRYRIRRTNFWTRLQVWPLPVVVW